MRHLRNDIHQQHAPHVEVGWTAPDSSTNTVFILQLTNQTSPVSQGEYTIASYNQKTFAPVGSLALNGIVGQPMKVIRWGGSGLAIATDTDQGQTISGPPGMLYILTAPGLITSGPQGAARKNSGGNRTIRWNLHTARPLEY